MSYTFHNTITHQQDLSITGIHSFSALMSYIHCSHSLGQLQRVFLLSCNKRIAMSVSLLSPQKNCTCIFPEEVSGRSLDQGRKRSLFAFVGFLIMWMGNCSFLWNSCRHLANWAYLSVWPRWIHFAAPGCVIHVLFVSR